MASRLPLRRYRDIRFFLSRSKRVEGQLARTTGLMGTPVRPVPAQDILDTVGVAVA
jgi:hypothetical protein